VCDADVVHTPMGAVALAFRLRVFFQGIGLALKRLPTILALQGSPSIRHKSAGLCTYPQCGLSYPRTSLFERPTKLKQQICQCGQAGEQISLRGRLSNWALLPEVPRSVVSLACILAASQSSLLCLAVEC